MPSTVVHGPREEAAWDRAKRAAHKQYDFSEENDRFWKIVNHIYQNMKAIESQDAMDLIDQDDDAELHRTGHMQKALVGLVLDKSYIRAHTRTLKDGRVVTVGAYFTKVVPKGEEPKKGRTRALKQPPARWVHPGQTHEQLAHRLVRHVHEGTMSHDEAEANLAHLERRAHAGHHLEHGTGSAWTPEETHQFIAHARGRLAEHKAGQEREAAERETARRETNRQRWQGMLQDIQHHLTAGGSIQVVTYTRATQYGPKDVDRFSANAYGLYVRQGKGKVHIGDTRIRFSQLSPQQQAVRDHLQAQAKQRQRIEELTGTQGAEPPAQSQGEHRPPLGISARERQEEWDRRMRQQQEEQAKQAQEKPQPHRGRGQRHREQVQELLAQRRAIGKSLLLGLLLRSA